MIDFSEKIGCSTYSFFGLWFEYDRGSSFWIDLRKPLGDQIDMSSTVSLRFRYRYMIMPNVFLDEVAVRQFYYEVRLFVGLIVVYGSS